jgi:hypothetical protein
LNEISTYPATQRFTAVVTTARHRAALNPVRHRVLPPHNAQLSHACYMLRPAHPTSFFQSSNNLRLVSHLQHDTKFHIHTKQQLKSLRSSIRDRKMKAQCQQTLHRHTLNTWRPLEPTQRCRIDTRCVVRRFMLCSHPQTSLSSSCQGV